MQIKISIASKPTYDINVAYKCTFDKPKRNAVKYGMVANNTAINKSMIRGAGFGMHELTSGAISDVFWQSCAF